MKTGVLLLAAAMALVSVPCWAAVPGLPFTEDFSADNLMDASNTNANWSTEDQALYLAWKEKQYGAFGAGNTTGSDITSDADDTQAIAVGDVDGDGDLDLVAGNDGVNRLYLNNGTADPWNGVSGTDITADMDNTRAVALGDVDNDGDLDLLTGNGGDSSDQVNRVYLNNGTTDPWNGVGGLSITADVYRTCAVALGDVDGDGDLDLVVGNYAQHNRVYLNDGRGTGWAGSDITPDDHNSQAVALGDVNGDGYLDIVVGNWGINRVYRNDGTGTAWSSGDITSDTHNSHCIALGDVDADGDIDVVAGNGYPAGEVNRWYTNNGSGTVWTGNDITSDTDVTYAVALGDVDSDGDVDVVVGNDGEVNRLYLNRGATALWSGVTGSDITSDAHATFDIVLHDANGDGDVDVVAGNAGTANRLYTTNNTTGNPWNSVSAATAGIEEEKTWNMVLDDVDGDGDLDLLAGTGYIDVPLRLYLNNGTSNPWDGVSGTIIASNTQGLNGMGLGDLDRDGDLDLVFVRYAGDAWLYLNNGTSSPWSGVSGTRIVAPEGDNDYSLGMAIGDVDNDGDLDLVVTNEEKSNRLYLNNGTADPFNGVIAIDATPEDLIGIPALADVDNDGDLDLILATQRGGSLIPNRLYLNNGSSNPWNGVVGTNIGSDLNSVTGIAVGDVDRDGDLDLVLGIESSIPNRLYLNNGTANPWAGVSGIDITSDSEGTEGVLLCDVDGDGDLDLVTNSGAVPNRLYLNNGTSDPWNGVVGLDLTSDGLGSLGIAVGDVDNDGDPDLVIGSDGSNFLYLNQAAPLHPWNESTIIGSDVTDDNYETRAVALGDVDGDGDIDLVAGNLDSGQVNRLYLNNGTIDPWTGVVGTDITSDADYTYDVALGDVDRDGDLDLVTQHIWGIRYYVNNGTADPWNGVSGIDIGGADSNNMQMLLLKDADGDGDIDIVTGGWAERTQVYLNNGTSHPWNAVAGKDITSDVYSTSATALGDVDGDGDLDLVTGNSNEPNRLYLGDDTAGAPPPDPSEPDPSVPDADDPGNVYAIVQSGGKVYVGGNFTTIGGVARNYLAAFDATTGAIDLAWNPDMNDEVRALAFFGGKVYAGGYFTSVNAGATSRNYLAAFNEADGSNTGTADAVWDPDVNGSVHALAIFGGKVYAGGGFGTVNAGTVARERLAAFETADGMATGVVDPAWNPRPNNAVYVLAISGSKVYVGGAFDRVQVTRNRLAALNLADGVDTGAPDAAWNPDVNNHVHALAVSGGKVYAAGDFTTVNGGATARNHLAAFNEADGVDTGTADAAWDPDIDNMVLSLAVSGGKVYIGGSFTTVNGGATARSSLAAFNPADGIDTGIVDSTWDPLPGMGKTVWASETSGTGVLVGGFFSAAGNLAGFGSTVVGWPDANPWEDASGSDIASDAHNTNAVALGDVDGDGDLDLVVGNNNQPNRLYLNNGTSDPWNSVTGSDITSDSDHTAAVALHDVDGDGDLDFVAGNTSYEPSRLYLNNGTSDPWNGVQGIDVTPDGVATISLALGDIDGNGSVDVVVGTDSGQRNRFYRGANLEYQTARGRAASLQVDTEVTDIPTARLTATATMPANTWIDYWLSNDGGVRWWQVKSHEPIVFPTTGSNLRWRAELGSLSPVLTPTVDGIVVTGGVPSIDPPVPDMETDEDVELTYDLTPHENDAMDSGPQLDWSIDPADTPLYTATIDGTDLLTITPKLNQSGVEAGVTLTLTNSRGYSDTQDIDITVVYQSPTAPTPFVLPSSPYTTENIFCLIVPGFVGPGRTAQYTYTWTNDGATKTIVHGPTTILEDTLSSSETEAGEIWTCTVVANDGASDSPSAHDSTVTPVQDLIISTLTLNASEAEIALGEYVTLDGSINPIVSGVSVFFDRTETPSGGTDNKPPTQITTGSGTFSHAFLPDEAGSWGFIAEWFGNTTTYGDFDGAAITVLKAQPTLSLELSHSSALLNFDQLTAWATLTAPMPGELSGLLSDQTIKLWMKKPDATAAGPLIGTTDDNGVAEFAPADFTDAGIVFDLAGTWQFLAQFQGDDNFLQSTSTNYDEPESARLTIKDRAGYAVIVVGKLDADGEGHDSHAKTADYAYRTFRDRGFAEEDIYYLREGGVQPAPDIYVDDTTPTQSDVQTAIESWAQGKMNATAAPLYVVFTDHGGRDKFYVYSGSLDETRVITPDELDGYFDTLQSGLDAEAQDEDIVLMYGACHSGSFIPTVSAEHRVIITSASEDEVSHRGVVDPDDLIRDGEVFVTELFRNASTGKTLKESFELASEKTVEYTASKSNAGASDQPQHALLDDNADGVGTVAPLSFEPGEDGSYAHELVLGYGVNAPDSVGWITVTQTLVIGPTDPVGELFAEPTEDPSAHTAWMEVKTPDYEGATRVDETNPENLQEAVVMEPFESQYLSGGAFCWNDFGATLEDPGTYKVFYYVKDGVTDETSTHMVTAIYRELAGNQPPAAVTLVYPDDFARVRTTTFFAWTESVDPEDDTVTYRLEVAEDIGFTTGLIVKEGIVGTVTQLTAADGINDLTSYYWRVIPVDEYGASPASPEDRIFNVDNENADWPGVLMGQVKDSVTKEPIVGASITVTPGPLNATSMSQGEYYVTNMTPGSYTVEVSASGHDSETRPSVTINAASTTEAIFLLVPDDAPFLWGEVSGDFVGSFDASLILQWVVGLRDWFPIDESTVKPDFPPCADVSGDGTLSSYDASLILQKKVGLLDCFPADLDCDEYGPDSAAKPGVAPHADGQEPVRVMSLPGAIAGNPGDEIEVPVTLDDATGVFSYFFDLRFDSAVLESTGIDAGTLTVGWGTPVVNAEPNRLRVAGAGTSALEGSGSIVVLYFRISDAAIGAQRSLLHLKSAELDDGLPVETVDGEVVIGLDSDGDGLPDNVETNTGIYVSAEDTGTDPFDPDTDGDGASDGYEASYGTNPHDAGDTPPLAFCDVNGDGRVDALDVQLVINAALGLEVMWDCDMDGDGYIDAVDVQLAINAALGIVG